MDLANKRSATTVHKKNNAVHGNSNDGRSECNMDVLSREAEYKRMNDELEARTASLVKEADQIMKRQDNWLSKPPATDHKPSLLENINTDDFLGLEAAVDEEVSYRSKTKGNELKFTSEATDSSRPSSSRPSFGLAPQQKLTNQKTQQALAVAAARNTKKLTKKTGTKAKQTNLGVEVAVPDEKLSMEFRDYSLDKAIAKIEGQLESGELSSLASDRGDDIMPAVATEMGVDAQIRFLKAKIRVMQEEIERLSQEYSKKEEECGSLAGRLKEVEETRGHLQKTNVAQQVQLDKYKKLTEESRGKAESLDVQLMAAKKELESMKRIQKQHTANESALEVRLNRAVEEADRYKIQLQKSKSESKESGDHEQRRVEQLLADNKRLEKQKNELVAGFKKQLKLIDVLKRQKMHIEAAKMLSFTEEEFVKALQWGNNT